MSRPFKWFLFGVMGFIALQFLLPFIPSISIPWVFDRAPVTFEGKSFALQHTLIVPTSDSPVPMNRNVIWCASFQMAWDRLKREFSKEPVRLNREADLVSRLNNGGFHEEDAPATSCSVAGRAMDGVAKRIETEMRQLFPGESIALPEPSQPTDAIVVFSYLAASADFAIPFFQNDSEFVFESGQGQKNRVASFGIRAKDQSAHDNIRKQVAVLYCRREERPEQREKGDRLREYVIDLCRSSPIQVLVARTELRASLADTWQSLCEKMALPRESGDWYADPDFQYNDIVLVPEMNWKISHHFSELEGRDRVFQNQALQGMFMDQAIQNIHFRLDRCGARLTSSAWVRMRCAPRHFLFNRPFLIVMKKRDSKNPFFLMWVDNDELLRKESR